VPLPSQLSGLMSSPYLSPPGAWLPAPTSPNPYDAYYSAGYPAASNLAGSAHYPGAWVVPPAASAPPSSHLVAPYLGHAPVYTTAAETANLYYGPAATLGAQHMLETPHVGSPFGAAYPAPVSLFLYSPMGSHH